MKLVIRISLVLGSVFGSQPSDLGAQSHTPALIASQDRDDQIVVRRSDSPTPILTQTARAEFRPYIHPIVAPDGIEILTEVGSDQDPYQSGLFWSFPSVNGRDYFRHPEGTHWKRQSARVVKAEAVDGDDKVQWETVYDLLDASGQGILRETQIWSLRDEGACYVIDLQWSGEGLVDVVIGESDYGGLFLCTPWKRGAAGKVVNNARDLNERADGKRAVWIDVEVHVAGRSEPAHIAMFDHPQNQGFPQPWRVDEQMGIGPAQSRLAAWRIAKGERATFRHQLVVQTGELDDVALTERWSAFSGQAMAFAQWQLAQQEGRRAAFLTPEQAVESMTLQEGIQANIFAAEPMMTQAMAFCWDAKGRIWIAENRDYESRQTGFSNDGASRIVILEDADRDGVADHRKVFLEGIPFPSAIAVGMGGLWLGAPPNLLFVPDRDGDDQADMDKIEIRLTGWGIRDRHETLNSFHWGPDGWLYGLQGFATPSQVGKPKGRGRLYKQNDPFPKKIDIQGDPVEINGGVWRYHPTKDRFEVVAHGFSNPWGIDYDSRGQLFITACVIPHLWHVIPGGIYHRQGGQHFNPHVYSDIRTIADHNHQSAHGGARIYQSDALPARYHGRIFMANIHEHAVLTDVLTKKGSGYVGRHGDDFALANNAQWIGFSIEVGPDGSVYVLDWHDADICGKEVLNKETGRIFRLSPLVSEATDFDDRYADLSELDDRALVKLQQAPSAWHVTQARIALQHRAASRLIDEGAVSALRRQFRDIERSVDLRLRAMWALHAIGQLASDTLVSSLDDGDEMIRAWAIQLLCEDFRPPAAALTALARMAVDDPSPVVRLYLASAVQRIDDAAKWNILEGLVRHARDASDHNLPKMIWFGLEPLVLKDTARALSIAEASRIPLITRHVGRRLGSVDRMDALLARIEQGEGDVQTNLLLGLRDAMEGEFDRESPQGWADVYAKLRSIGGETGRIALQLSQQFGDSAAADAMLQTLRDPGAPASDRLLALQGLVGRKHPDLPLQLIGLLDDDEMRREAIRGMGSFDDDAFAKELLRRYPDLSWEDKQEVVHLLASRSNYGAALTAAIERGEVPKSDVPAYVARLLHRVVGNRFVDVWGPIDELGSDKEATMARYRELLNEAAIGVGDLTHGRVLFNRSCAACHRLHGHGGEIGPDITGANRTNLEYLLNNIVTPSSIVQDAYKMHIVLMDDGRVFSGIPVEENERQLKLRLADRNEPIAIAKSQIESREIAAVSMMPEGLLSQLQDQEIVDLVAYLQSPKQVPLPSP